MSDDSSLEVVLKRDRVVVGTSLVLVFLGAAAYTVVGVGMNVSALTMTQMALAIPEMAMQPMIWSAGHALIIFFMWWVMMIAMMMPSAAAVVLIHAAVGRKQTGVKWPLVGTAVFIAGYLVVWAGFSLVATALQWSLENLGIVTGMTEIASPIIAALVLVAAGLYQMSPLKNACLSHCQHPMAFITQRWRPGGFGAFWMGLEHGAYCVGCCWFLMALLFVGGIMNLIFIAAIALYIGIEKLAAGQHWLRKFSGAGLTMAGLYVLGKQFMTT